MSINANDQNIFWDVQISIANAVARQEKPSLAKLHHDILEEIGQRPGKKLIEYFLEIAEIPSEEKEEYLKYVGISKAKDKKSPTKLKKETGTDPHIKLADDIASGDDPTVLKFRTGYNNRFNELPSTKLIEYFLKKIRDVKRSKTEEGGVPDKETFVEKIAANPDATVLQFRSSFTKEFGVLPSPELTQYFLKRLQETATRTDFKGGDDESDAKYDFAKNAADHNIVTILQFVKGFEKVFGKEPSVELIDIFIKNIPRSGSD